MEIVEVVAGIVWNRGRVLVARRAPHKSQAGKWEFPGGKIEKGESPETALERELHEELGIQTKTEGYFATNVHYYPTITIKLIAYHGKYLSGEITPIDHDQVEWIRVKDLLSYEVTEADIPFVHKLIAQTDS